ncbi:hypothetical protein WDV93_05880 [Pantoea ananatis]
MLTPQPKFNVGASSSTDNKPNLCFPVRLLTPLRWAIRFPFSTASVKLAGDNQRRQLWPSDQQWKNFWWCSGVSAKSIKNTV